MTITPGLSSLFLWSFFLIILFYIPRCLERKQTTESLGMHACTCAHMYMSVCYRVLSALFTQEGHMTEAMCWGLTGLHVSSGCWSIVILSPVPTHPLWDTHTCTPTPAEHLHSWARNMRNILECSLYALRDFEGGATRRRKEGMWDGMASGFCHFLVTWVT